MASSVDMIGIAAALLGAILFLWKNKRKFVRTNAVGVEQFSSYGRKVAARIGDSTIWLLAFFSLTGGILTLALEHQSTWGWIVLLPCYALLLFGVPIGRSK